MDTSQPFSYRQGLEGGIGRGALFGPRFARPFHGVRTLAHDQADAVVSVPDALLLLCTQLAPRLRAGQFFSSETALALYGAPTPRGWQPCVHVAVHRPSYPPRTPGVVRHRLQTRMPLTREVHGIPVEDPVRAWVQASRIWRADDLVAAADFLVSPHRRLVSVDELQREASRMRGNRLDAVCGDIREGSESPQETRLRLAIVRAGLPEPILNLEIFDGTGRFVARLDGAYPQYRVAVEYDGRQHAEDSVQFARDADRWDDVRSEGWDLVRILHHHMRDGAAPAVEKVRTALRRAGWRG